MLFLASGIGIVANGEKWGWLLIVISFGPSLACLLTREELHLLRDGIEFKVGRNPYLPAIFANVFRNGFKFKTGIISVFVPWTDFAQFNIQAGSLQTSTCVFKLQAGAIHQIPCTMKFPNCDGAFPPGSFGVSAEVLCRLLNQWKSGDFTVSSSLTPEVTPEFLKRLAGNHRRFREAILYLICTCVAFGSLVASGALSGGKEDAGFLHAAVGFGFLFIFSQLWPLAFRLYPRLKAIGFVVCFVDDYFAIRALIRYRKALRLLRANGINPKLSDVFKLNLNGSTKQNRRKTC